MSAPSDNCGLERRREAVRASALMGLDSVDVSASQTQLDVFFLGRAPQELAADNLQLTGGTPVTVTGLHVYRQKDLTLDDWMEVDVDRPGDASTYTLSLVQTDDTGASTPMPGVDPIYGAVSFSFKASCPSDADCLAPHECPPPTRTAPPIDYLAKDYASFRQLILDRLAQTTPDWTETHIPDVGVMLVDLLAYAGDQLSYYQDAVATEAYLGTARRRISLRRHARLVDYRMHEGCNARAWVSVTTEAASCDLDPTTFFFSTSFSGGPSPGVVQPADFARAPAGSAIVFEPLVADPSVKITLRQAHNEIQFYTWGDCACCLPIGATSATLADFAPSGDGGGAAPPPPPPGNITVAEPVSRDVAPPPAPIPRILSLQAGDVLMFEEVIGPRTGAAADADPTHRQAVRLTSVVEDIDPLYSPDTGGLPVLRIAWCAEDKLTFPLCLSAVMPAPDCSCREGISVARGNVILVDQGVTLPPEPLGSVPTETRTASCPTDCEPPSVTLTAGPFHSVLAQSPLTFAQPLPACACAATVSIQDPRQALPEITLTSVSGGSVPTTWRPAYDLLESGADDASFVVEVDDDRRAHLRFGNGDEGRQPDAGAEFTASYRVGDGPAGNVGAESIVYLVFRDLTEGLGALVPRNMLAGAGGTAPESAADVRMTAPYAFRDVLERAITADDYAALAKDNARRLAAQTRSRAGRRRHRTSRSDSAPCLTPFEPLQNAQGALCWNGSWYEARVAVDPLGAETADAALLEEIDAYLCRYRRIGHDLSVVGASYVALDLGLSVCVKPLYLQAHVEATVRRLLGTGVQASGAPALFNPDALTFGQAVFVSPIVAAVQAVPGVLEAQVTRLDRLIPGRPPPTATPDSVPPSGQLSLGASEIARLDQDPNAPGDGRLTLLMRGGR